MPNKGNATLLIRDHPAKLTDIALVGAKTTGNVVDVEAGSVSSLYLLFAHTLLTSDNNSISLFSLMFSLSSHLLGIWTPGRHQPRRRPHALAEILPPSLTVKTC
jgi:hypothetical protein